MNKPIRHGEVLLVPVTDIPTGMKHEKAGSYIVGHSETGHHHVLESKTKFDVFMDEATKALYLDIPVSGKLVHLKAVDKHKTLSVPLGKYKVVHKTEYDPWQQIMRAVFD